MQCFISNADNLGATVDLGILEMCLAGSQEFVMEVTEKTQITIRIIWTTMFIMILAS